ncbi:MAG TPA: nucleotidyltransferase domain-containing protein [Anaerolineae bacterium]|nr:nucleotidyltransferase domain-containing protein [Anaerolineae bacterium]
MTVGVREQTMETVHQDTRREHSETLRLDEVDLVAFLATQPDVIAAYLFGSLAEERATPRSDVDIAILFADASDPLAVGDRQLQLMGELERFADREVDVVVLNTAPPVLQHQVLRHGRLLYERNRRARVDFEVRAGQMYADLQPMRDFFRRALFQEIREGRFGGRR